MKVYLNANQQIDHVEEKEFLIQGNDGANVIELYMEKQLNDVTISASFRRSDQLLIHEIPLVKADDNWYVTIYNDSGILAVAGELEISFHIRKIENDKLILINTQIVTTTVLKSISISEKDQDWYIGMLASEIEKLKAELEYLKGKKTSTKDLINKNDQRSKIVYQTSEKTLIYSKCESNRVKVSIEEINKYQFFLVHYHDGGKIGEKIMILHRQIEATETNFFLSSYEVIPFEESICIARIKGNKGSIEIKVAKSDGTEITGFVISRVWGFN